MPELHRGFLEGIGLGRGVDLADPHLPEGKLVDHPASRQGSAVTAASDRWLCWHGREYWPGARPSAMTFTSSGLTCEHQAIPRHAGDRRHRTAESDTIRTVQDSPVTLALPSGQPARYRNWCSPRVSAAGAYEGAQTVLPSKMMQGPSSWSCILDICWTCGFGPAVR
jgi:hypothetical protein